MRGLEAGWTAVDQAQPLQREDARTWLEGELAGSPPVGRPEVDTEEAGGDVFAHRAQVSREGAEVEDVVVDGGQRHERAQPVAAHDEPFALQHLEGLAEGHQGHLEFLGETTLIVETSARRDVARANAIAQSLRDLMVPRHPSLHVEPSRLVF